jgi:hypothetical protein
MTSSVSKRMPGQPAGWVAQDAEVRLVSAVGPT